MLFSNKIHNWLKNQNSIIFSLVIGFAAFSTYACMYAFRKPFSVATFDDMQLFGMGYKSVIIIAQVLGYTLSKFVGIKVISEMPKPKRALAIITLIGIAEIALLAFWLVPTPYNFIFLFLNGFPLGMIWGLVFSYLEGRKTTEILGALLSVSFIVSSGVVKSVGKYIMLEWGVSEFAMPFTTGMIFSVPLVLSLLILNSIPEPSEEDEALRTKRQNMNKTERWAFFRSFAPSIVLLTLIYMFLSAFRDIRDNFAAEIFNAIGYADDAAIFTQTETPIAIFVLIVIASLVLIKKNEKALLVNHVIVGLGLVLIGLSTLGFQQQIVSPFYWMLGVGLGGYLAYVPFNCILFDRLIATYKTAANAGFLIYIADSFGYLSSVGVMFYKNFGSLDMNWYHFFVSFCYVISVFGAIATAASFIYFAMRFRKVDSSASQPKEKSFVTQP